MTRRASWLVGSALTLAGHLLGCASEQTDFPAEDEVVAGGGRSGSGSAGRGLPLSGTTAVASGGAPNTTRAGASSGGTSSGSAGRSSQSAGATAGGTSNPGVAGTATAGSTTGGSAGALNQPTPCDEATATVLGAMSSNLSVASNACLKMTLPADQTWIKKLTLQPDGGTYPLPYSWTNCGTNSSGAFSANYANQVLSPVTAQCPILVKLLGTGTPLNIQWWGG